MLKTGTTKIYNRLLNSFLWVNLSYYSNRIRLILNKPKHIKLNLGCGNIRRKEFINIDHRRTRATDKVCDIRKLPYPSNSVKIIESYHVIEHVSHTHVPKMLREWFRVLEHGGKLIIECPDFDRAAKEYLEGNEQRIYNIFGLQRFPGDTHLFGYNPHRISRILSDAGFSMIRQTKPKDYHKDEEPCMRVECVKE